MKIETTKVPTTIYTDKFDGIRLAAEESYDLMAILYHVRSDITVGSNSAYKVHQDIRKHANDVLGIHSASALAQSLSNVFGKDSF